MKILLIIVIFSITFLVHYRTIDLGFYLDDWGMIYWLENGNAIADFQINRGVNLYGPHPNDNHNLIYKNMGLLPWWLGPFTKVNFFRPFTSVSLWTDYYLYGANSKGFHLSNITMLAVCGSLLFCLTHTLTNRLIWALCSSLLFVSTPFANDVARYIAPRSELVALITSITTLLLYKNSRDAKTKIYYYLSLFAYVMALLSKESAVFTPVMLIAMDIFDGSTRVKLLWKSWSGYIIITICFLIFFNYNRFGAQVENLYYSPFDNLNSYLSRAPLSICVALSKLFLGPWIFSLPYGFAYNRVYVLLILLAIIALSIVASFKNHWSKFYFFIPFIFLPLYPCYTHLSFTDNWSYLTPSLGIVGVYSYILTKPFYNQFKVSGVSMLAQLSTSALVGVYFYFSLLYISEIQVINIGRYKLNQSIAKDHINHHLDKSTKHVLIFSVSSQAQLFYLAHTYAYFHGQHVKIHSMTPCNHEVKIVQVSVNTLRVNSDGLSDCFSSFPLSFGNWDYSQDLHDAIPGLFSVSPILRNGNLESLEFVFNEPLSSPAYKILTCNSGKCITWDFEKS